VFVRVKRLVTALCRSAAAVLTIGAQRSPPLVCGLTSVGAAMALLSTSRTIALIRGYNAPMRLFSRLPSADGPALVCLGAEWYRFPSSFFLPGAGYRLGFVQTGFAGMLPLPYDVAAGGTSHGSPLLNDENRAVPEQYVASPSSECDFWLGLSDEEPPEGAVWRLVAEAPFLDASRSPALWRAFHVPLVSSQRNAYTSMRLLARAFERP